MKTAISSKLDESPRRLFQRYSCVASRRDPMNHHAVTLNGSLAADGQPPIRRSGRRVKRQARRHVCLLGLQIFPLSCEEARHADEPALEFGAPILSVGVGEGDPDETFGLIGDIAVRSDAEILALDIQARVLHRIVDGEVVEHIGRAGRQLRFAMSSGIGSA